MKRTTVLSLFALLLLPALAIAEPPAAAAIGSQGCDSSLSFLAAAPVTPAGGTLPAFSPLASSEPKAADCCTAKRIACVAGCARCGVFEFSCDATATPCQSSCICNIC